VEKTCLLVHYSNAPERRLEGVRLLFLPPSSTPPERRLEGVRLLFLPPSQG